MSIPDTRIINQAIELLDRGLDYRMSSSARAWAESGLSQLRNGDIEDGIDSICNAAAICDEPLSTHYLIQARELLAPDRFASA